MAKKFEIGNITLPNRYILAPMAGYTNEPLRKMAREGGAGLVYTEMISATALAYNNQKTFDMLPRDNSENPLALQLFGGDKNIILNAIDFVEKEAKYDFLDFNMGCPVPKVMKQEAGSYWLKRQDEVYDLLHSMVQKSHKPVIIKIRLGFDKKHINAVEIAKIAEQAGIKALAVHGRTRDEYYNGFPHYDEIAKVKNSVSIPVIANGNIDLNNIAEVEEITNADAFMIGRGCLGNPLIFTDLINSEEGKSFIEHTLEKQIDLMKKHFDMIINYMGEYNGVRYFRGLSVLYVKGFDNAKYIKNKLISMNTVDDFNSIIKETKDYYLK